VDPKQTKYVSTKAELKTDEGEGQGKLRATFSTFDVIDRDGDVVKRSAIQNGVEVPMVWAHQWDRPIGKGVVKVGREHAIFDGQLWLDTDDGVQAFRKIKNAGPLQEYSWGFQINEWSYGQQDEKDVRIITGAEIFEVSPVLVGSNRETGTLSIKGLSLLDGDVLQELTSILGALKEQLASGRTIEHPDPTERREPPPAAPNEPGTTTRTPTAPRPVLKPTRPRRPSSR
jgi:HK97 family phage prohead protease